MQMVSVVAFKEFFFHSLLLFIVVEDSMICIAREFLPAMFNPLLIAAELFKIFLVHRRF